MNLRAGRISIAALFLTLPSVFAQLTPEQKAIDLQTIASLYSKQYAPYEWKRDNFKFDLLDLRPWIERVRQSKDDLEYLEIVAEYVASLQDIHSYYVVNSDFVADLHLYTDVYDGKVLIEIIDRQYLPASRFDFAVGDEIVQFDGKPVMEVLKGISKMNSFGNPRSTDRWAADFLVYRQQTYLPKTAELGDVATLLIRRADGSQKSYTIPWDKTGTPLRKLGPQPNFRLGRGAIRSDGPVAEPEPEAPADPGIPAFRRPLLALQRHVGRPVKNLRGYGVRDPIFRMPAGFTQRLGRSRSDYFYSGTYTQEGKRVGFIRIGTFQPVGASLLSLPLRQFEQEIGFMKANTDVLVVDVTRNEGGFACYVEALTQYLINKRFTTIGVEIRPNLQIIQDFRFYLQDAEDFGEDWEVALYRSLVKDLETAYSENRGRTGPIPLCGPGLEIEPARSANGNLLAYDRPILLLTDEFTTSGGDTFAAALQDAQVAKLFGYRTAGAGGNTELFQAGFFSEGSTNVTQMMTLRPIPQAAPGFPVSRYLENVGVRPDIEYDYQTRDNLLQDGRPFVEAFLKAAAALVK